MLDRFIGIPPPEGTFQLLREYNRCITALQRAGLIILLTQPEHLGKVGIRDADGVEYPIPTFEQVQLLFEANRELVEEKMGQGFTRLQLTPFALPISYLHERVEDAIKRHAADGKIFQAKRTPTDPDVPVPVRVNQDESVWIWSALQEVNGGIVYFPTSYDERNHGGMTKKQVLASQPNALRGWIVQLIEEDPFLPREGQGKTQGGRKQLENNHSPEEYFSSLEHSSHKGEAGLTIEDFLVEFLTRLIETNQVSSDLNDFNALWLTGNYHAITGLVPNGYWYRSCGELALGWDNHHCRRGGCWGVRSVVRLS